MCKYLSLSHNAKIHIILIKQTIFSKKRGKNKSSLLFGNFKNAYLYITLASYSKLTELGYKLFATRLFVVLTFVPIAVPLNELPTTKLSDILAPLKP